MPPEESGVDARAWLDRSKSSLSLARQPKPDQAHWADLCYLAQQAAEKALKALYQHHHAEGWGHVLDHLVAGLLGDEPDLLRLRDTAKILDKFYIPTRYPNGLEAGAPADAYTEVEAGQAIQYAQEIISFCEARCRP
ncbi:MAG: HEPN domain-containing protein [Planctomycetes bacterium]|nr:HEPN domain-containing protein [Planctomycetota bacterium]